MGLISLRNNNILIAREKSLYFQLYYLGSVIELDHISRYIDEASRAWIRAADGRDP